MVAQALRDSRSAKWRDAQDLAQLRNCLGLYPSCYLKTAADFKERFIVKSHHEAAYL
jgi:hypothetical protein